MLSKITYWKFKRYNYWIDPDKSLIKRVGLKSKHLVWSFGGLPTFNKELVDQYPNIHWFGAKLDTGKSFLIRREDLTELVQWREPQLTCKDMDKWIIKQI